MKKLKKTVFKKEKQIDIDFSYTGHFFCNISHDKIKVFIYPDLTADCVIYGIVIRKKALGLGHS